MKEFSFAVILEVVMGFELFFLDKSAVDKVHELWKQAQGGMFCLPINLPGTGRSTNIVVVVLVLVKVRNIIYTKVKGVMIAFQKRSLITGFQQYTTMMSLKFYQHHH